MEKIHPTTKPTPCSTTNRVADKTTLLKQLTFLEQHYQQDPVVYLKSYLKILNDYLQYLRETHNDSLIALYSKKLIDTYASLPPTQLELHKQDYADALIDYTLSQAKAAPETTAQQLDKTDLELYDSYSLTALDCLINTLDKNQQPQQLLDITKKMLHISKQAMQQSNNIQRQQEYLYCLNKYLNLLSQLQENAEPIDNIIGYYQEALSLYQTLYQQSTEHERPYADTLIQYNQLLRRQQLLNQATACNRQIINHCLQQFQQDPKKFTGYLYRTALEQLGHCLDSTDQLPLALQVFIQAVHLFEQQAKQSDHLFHQENLAYALTQCAKYLAQHNQLEQAISYNRRSVAIYIELLSQSPDYELASEKALIQYQILTGQI